MTTRSLARLGTLASLALGLMGAALAQTQDKSADDVAQLKAQLAQQQKQIEELTRRLDGGSGPPARPGPVPSLAYCWREV